MESIRVMFANYWTTLAGIALAVLYYLQSVGTKLPQGKGEWLQFWVGLGIAAFGVVSKDALTGSKPPKILPALLALPLLLGGCTFNADVIAKQLATSDRSWCVSVSSIYGTLRASGTGINAGRVACTQEGMTVTAKEAIP